eukprot:Gb_35525 [translate_table: standard]
MLPFLGVENSSPSIGCIKSIGSRGLERVLVARECYRHCAPVYFHMLISPALLTALDPNLSSKDPYLLRRIGTFPPVSYYFMECIYIWKSAYYRVQAESQSCDEHTYIISDLNLSSKDAYLSRRIRTPLPEKYAGAFSHCPDSQAIFRPVAPEIQPVTVLVPSKEAPPKGSARDDHEQGIFKKVETISAMVQTALPGKESPSNNVIYCPGKNKLDSQKFHSLKSRKQLSETGPTTERVIIPSTGREAEIDYDRHVRLKTSSVDGHTSISGKRARCTLEENQVIRQTNTTIANNTTTMSEASTDKDCRPRMWLQRWIHSSGKTDLRESNSGENLSSNLVINDGPLSRSSIREWSGDNRKVDRLQWPKGRRKGSIGHFSGYSSQPSRERQFNSELKGNQFRKDLFTPSASAMAIMGTRTKEMYAARPFPVWASTQRADADAKAAELGKDIKTPDDLELKPKNKAFEQRTAEQKDVCI